MQIDMHFYGTYAIARAAGIPPEEARVIATSAQFVDDATETDPAPSTSGAFFVPVASCHEMESSDNLEIRDQWHVWLPYHFLPGNLGRHPGERLICRAGRAGNRSADAMIAFALANAREPYGAHLMGVVTHVLQDTFSHDGFVGVSSEYNCVKRRTIDIGSITDPELLADKRSLINDFVSDVLEAPGHAAVGCLPDYPYLDWGFEYEHGADRCPRSHEDIYFRRDNKLVFAESCKRLHEVLAAFGKARQGGAYQGPNKEYAEIALTVAGILSIEAHRDRRGRAWKTALEAQFFCDTEEEDNGVAYDKDAWRGDVHGGENIYPGSDAVLFMQASHRYRAFVLSELLPTLVPA